LYIQALIDNNGDSSLTRNVMQTPLPFKKLFTPFNSIKLMKELHSLDAHYWLEHVNKRVYQGGWDVLPLRCQKQNLHQHPIIQSFAIEEGQGWVNLGYVQTCSEITRVLNYFQCEVKAARLMRLKPDAYIQPHRDKGLAMEYGQARFHIPISGAEQIDFLINNISVPMAVGELWYVNADMEHSVRNNGTEDRVNLVIDCQVNDWLINEITAECC
jgi:mannose-6-phosphate isomerase-like protein (cupin superfamily)